MRLQLLQLGAESCSRSVFYHTGVGQHEAVACFSSSIGTDEPDGSRKSRRLAKKQAKKAPNNVPQKKGGRPKGSRNKNKAAVVLNPE